MDVCAESKKCGQMFTKSGKIVQIEESGKTGPTGADARPGRPQIVDLFAEANRWRHASTNCQI